MLLGGMFCVAFVIVFHFTRFKALVYTKFKRLESL